jgi:CRP-like cAMP-binding protein
MLIQIPEGTAIILEGEANMDMYKIISGSVELYTGYGTRSETILAIKSKDDYIGEMGLFTHGRPAIYTAVAFSDVVLKRITQDDVDEFIKTNHVDVYRILENMAESMYGMKYSMDMYVRDVEEKGNIPMSKDVRIFFSSCFAKYNEGNGRK